MDKQTIRFILLSLVIFVGFSLFSKYSKEQQFVTKTVDANVSSNTHGVPVEPELDKLKDIPSEMGGKVEPTSQAAHHDFKYSVDAAIVTVDTDVLNVKINSHGDLIYAELKKYPQDNKKHQKGFALLSEGDNRFYIAQSGFMSEVGPDSKIHGRAKFIARKSYYSMANGDKNISVDLTYSSEEGAVKDINFIKRFIFHKNSYVIDVQYIIDNNSDKEYRASMYGRLRRYQPKSTGGFFSGGLKTYTGAAINTPDEKYKKISFSDMKTPYKIAFNGGWIAMLEHYFVSAWVPGINDFSEYQTEQFNDDSFGIRFVNAPINVASGDTKTVSAKLFVGPKVSEILKEISPALDLTVDYGVLWWLCVPLFWLLKAIFNIIGNWGWAIIFTTLLIKILFYHLSASSYRSMGNLRKLQPKIEALKVSCGEDKQKFSQSVMELYRKEKVNPLGGCLPIVVQIPVFISLYYVLLESVELRQATWCMWVMDLSAKDPFYILPIIMGISMFVQQRMNPPPPDPMQAKVLMVMPAFFTVLFLQFPSGLMLYWIVNNTLSILQQMFITRNMDKVIATKGFKN